MTAMPMTKPEHRPGAEIRSETITLGYCKARLSDGRLGEGYRLDLSKRRSVGHGADVWIPVYNWRCLNYELPVDGLSQWEVHKALEAMQAEATRLYQAEQQRRACRRRENMLAHRDHEEPQHEVETEHLPDRTLCRIK